MARRTAASKEAKSLAAVENWNKRLSPLGHEVQRLEIKWPKPQREQQKEQRRGFMMTCVRCRTEARDLHNAKRKCVAEGGAQRARQRPDGRWW